MERLTIDLGARSYPILVGPGLRREIRGTVEADLTRLLALGDTLLSEAGAP